MLLAKVLPEALARDTSDLVSEATRMGGERLALLTKYDRQTFNYPEVAPPDKEENAFAWIRTAAQEAGWQAQHSCK